VAEVLAVVVDLMLASRVEELLRAADHDVSVVNALPEQVDADLIVCDLDSADAAGVAAAGRPTIGFYQHTDTDTRDRAEAAGIDVVVPRSRMVRELPQLVERLL
jgi:hypothetical protein